MEDVQQALEWMNGIDENYAFNHIPFPMEEAPDVDAVKFVAYTTSALGYTFIHFWIEGEKLKNKDHVHAVGEISVQLLKNPYSQVKL